ncbi:MAG: MBL fold metallo-hydrolase [Flavobacteriales bacterium]|nr:MBL fold metallo-hydrolase [Flavobacteriales bacterium]
MRVTFLGTGTSQGVPVIACNCEVCTSKDVRDNRLRTSVLVEIEGQHFVVDAGPDFRQQMLREGVEQLSAVVFTHEHKDHISGLDDVRAFNYRQKMAMPVLGSHRVYTALKREYHYAFGDNTYPGVPQLDFREITNDAFTLGGVQWQPIEVLHYTLPVHGFRIGDFTYITDAKTIAPAEMDKIRGSKVLVLNALRKEPHLSHFNLHEALEVIEEIKPQKAYLTHISHLFGTHEEISRLLPDHVEVAYDRLTFEI